MEKDIFIQSPVSPQRRYLLSAGGAPLLSSLLALASVQREETLSDDVASAICGPINNVNPPWLVFASAQEGERQLSVMSSRLTRYVPDEDGRRRLLVNIQYEISRTGPDPQVILGLIEVESAFRQYAISGVDVRGLMQVVPFWENYIGKPSHNFLDIRTSLHYDCTILCRYSNLENDNLYCVLARFNGSLGSGKYPDAVLGVWYNRWQRG